MTRRRTRPLRLEVVEDRCLPSMLHGGPPPLADAHRDGPVFARAFAESSRPDRDADPRGRIETFAIILVPTATVPSPPSRPARRVEVAVVADPPGEGVVRAQPLSVAIPTDGVAPAVRPTSPAQVSARPPDTDAPTPNVPRTVAVESGSVGFVFHGGVEVPDVADLPAALPVPPVPVPTLPELPSPRAVVERVIDMLPFGVPLAGVVPLNDAALEAAADLLAQLPLVADAADGWESPERWAWVTAGVLVAGGAAYAARGARTRRAVPALGLESSFARWEDRRAD